MNREKVLALAFEQSSDGLLLMRGDGVAIDCNPAAVAMFGCQDKSEMIGRGPLHFSPEYQPDGRRSADRVREIMAQVQADGHACFEWENRRVDGQPLRLEVRLTAIEYEGEPIVQVTWHDISRRREIEDALAYRRQLETLITSTSGHFINLPTEAIGDGIRQALGDLGTFVAADRSYVFVYTDGQMHNLYEWCAPGIEPQIDRMQNIPIESMQWSNDQILRGDILNTPVVAELPPEAQAEKDEFAVQGIRSALVVPMERRGQVVGFVGFDAVRQNRHWPEEIVDLLRMAAGMIANVLDRYDAELRLKEINAQLEQRIAERTQELEQRREVAESLRETLAVVNSNQSLDDTLAHIAQQARKLTGAGACVIYSVDRQAGTARVEAVSGAHESVLPLHAFDLDSTPGRELEWIVAERQPLALNYDKSRVHEIEDDPHVVGWMRAARLEMVRRFSASLAAPLISRDVPFGAIILHYEEPQSFIEQQLKIAHMLAEQAALAIENAHLYEAEQERRAEAEQRHRIAEGLREGLSFLNASLALPEILDFVVRQAVTLLDTGGGALYLLDERRHMLCVGASAGLDASYTALELPVGGAITGRAVAVGEPVAVPDLETAQPLLDEYLNEPNIPPGWGAALRQLTARYKAVLAVPVRTGTRVYGAITLYYPQRQQFTDEVIGLAVAFAGQAALVIENARLHERVRETAAVEERNRLARDLHDAVTQTLFSASVIADVLPDLWQVDPDDAQRQLARLTQLTRGALAEMRTLLIELRPARLVEADMTTLLQQLIDAAQGRSKVEIALNVQGLCELPPDTKIAFYRIAQEALNNIIKHAHAEHAFISLRCLGDRVTLQVLDDGRGFDLTTIKAGHFGVQFMGERAAAIGAVLVVDTSPGEGTDIQVTWSYE